MQIGAWHGKTATDKPGGKIVGTDLSVLNLKYWKFKASCSAGGGIPCLACIPNAITDHEGRRYTNAVAVGDLILKYRLSNCSGKQHVVVSFVSFKDGK